MKSTRHQPPQRQAQGLEPVETASSREAPTPKLQTALVTNLLIGIWSFLGAWCLGFGASRARLAIVPGLAILGALASCRPDMANQPRVKPLSGSEFFSDGTNARPLPPHTVARGDLRSDQAYYTGLTNGVYVTQLPVQLTPELLARGRDRFDAFCAVCHGRAGDGQGVVVHRGFPAPPSYHVDRLRNAPIGHFYDVMTNGYGAMISYAPQIDPDERWAIAAYIRALQLSQHATVNELPPDDQGRLNQ